MLDCSAVSPARLTVPSSSSEATIHAFSRITLCQQRWPIAVYVILKRSPFPSLRVSLRERLFSSGLPTSRALSVGVQVVCDFDEARSQIIELRGRDVANQLIEHLADLAKKYDDLLKHPVSILMREEDEIAFRDSDACHICKGPFLPIPLA